MINRRAFLGGAAGVAVAGTLGAAGPTALPDYVSGSVIQRLLDAARDGAGTTDAAGRRIAKVPKGTYLLTRPLIIHGGTHLDATEARIVARFPATGVKHTMLLNSVADTTGGYSGRGNIAVTGGSWDPVWDFVQRGVLSQAPAMNVLTFVHTSDVLVRNVTIWNVKWWHAIELNAVRRGTVSGCALKGWIADPGVGLWHGEAVQLDLAAEGTAWAGLEDRTPCRDILLTGNVCDTSGSQAGWGQFTGSHTAYAGHVHANVRIENNTVANTRWDAIGTLNAKNVRITGNTVTGCAGGIYVKSIQNQPLATVEITGNRVSGIGDRDALAIRADAAGAPITDVVVDGNTVNCAKVRYYGAVTPRAGAVLQCR
ncbi:right-handed parallel beta-helix repeat-containing protein [Planomonospora sp. ID67723]|uniref:right-handed parallel beta-helix repeat-containing protein n=1 Tax=Planomonospora sp. ID67723 TaxID=2738134 RepID=UPI0018C42D3D|nr:right-handed parallel beta-helix repeat-containing protein [Planomonospora sp. ID67723]MBG0833138.1 right-handed parallel beta-helix repeat-containing protein [Planomonospora sp. ID67723]